VTDLSSRAAALVRAGRGAMRPSAADRERVSAALRACLGDGALPLEVGASTSLFYRSGWTKVCAVGAALGIVGGAAFLMLRGSGSAQSLVPRAAEVSEPRLEATQPVVPPRATASLSVEPKAGLEASTASEPVRRPSDRLAQEVAILSRATSELHAGRAASALRAIDEHQRKFPSGLLADERPAARVQALCALGRRAEPAPELERLTRRAPQSPNTLRAKKLCGVAARPR